MDKKLRLRVVVDEPFRVNDEDPSYDQFPGDNYVRRLFEHRLTHTEYVELLIAEEKRKEVVNG